MEWQVYEKARLDMNDKYDNNNRDYKTQECSNSTEPLYHSRVNLKRKCLPMAETYLFHRRSLIHNSSGSEILTGKSSFRMFQSADDEEDNWTPHLRHCKKNETNLIRSSGIAFRSRHRVTPPTGWIALIAAAESGNNWNGNKFCCSWGEERLSIRVWAKGRIEEREREQLAKVIADLMWRHN